MSIRNYWDLTSSHGSILFYIAVVPDCTINEIADAMSLTRHTVWGVIGDLRKKEMLKVRKDGRRHHYTVNLDAPFLHPVIDGITLETVLSELIDRAKRENLAAARPS